MSHSVGIPTNYSGVRFRSRLEARYARLFDLLRLDWEYEPRDFNGWVPDFHLRWKHIAPSGLIVEHILYVEVKPIIELPNDVRRKIDASDCEKPVLVLGDGFPADLKGRMCFGWCRTGRPRVSGPVERARIASAVADLLGSDEADEAKIRSELAVDCWAWDYALPVHTDDIDFDLVRAADYYRGYFPADGLLSGRCYDKWQLGPGAIEQALLLLWWEAGNVTQWKPRR